MMAAVAAFLGALTTARARCRLLVEGTPLYANSMVSISQNQKHYLLNVMRLADQEVVLVFNGADGEWTARVQMQGKKSCSLLVCEQCRPQPKVDNHTMLIFSPLKPKRTSLLIEKAVELGVTSLMPCIMQRSSVREVNMPKLKSTISEATEQSHRLQVPTALNTQRNLQEALAACQGREVICAAEPSLKAGAPPLTAFLQGRKTLGSISFVLGPEGGFHPAEFDLLREQSVNFVSLGENTLRAETAALAALAIAHAMRGAAH